MNNLERFKKALDWEPIDRLMTYDFLDNSHILLDHGGYDPSRTYTYEELIEVNARAWKRIGVDATRSVYDPVNHWMGGKITNWIRFFGVNPDNWAVSQAGETAWISKRPFHTLAELEKHMPRKPIYEEVRDWYQPVIRQTQLALAQHDIVFIGAVEGPITDAYTYTDMELFAQAIYDAPELVAHIMDCTGLFSAYIARAYAEVTEVPLLFMGEDISGTSGPIFSPRFVREQGLPRWKWISEPIKEKGMKFLYHTDGRYGKFLPLIFDDFAADGLNPIERNNCNDIFAIRKEYPHKLLFGNVCCMHTLPHGTLFPSAAGALMVTRPANGEPHTMSNGFTQGFAAKTFAEVDAFHAAGLANGGTCEGPPGVRENAPGKAYGAYLRDPDGNKICAFAPNPDA